MNPRQVAEMGVARTFQNLALFKGMSVLDNIMTGRNLKMKTNLFQQALRWGAAEREETAHRRVVENIIDFLEIQAYRKTPVGKMPYGLQKRVDLGRALAMEPQVLLLDEPMAGMNVEEKQDMSRFILDVNDEFGTTIVLIEHDMGVVMDISDRVVVLDYGRKIGDGSPDEVRTNPGRDQRLPRHRPLAARDMGSFLETLFGGLMVGMLYSLIALGFVLIYKASGVFNFAQGAMVLFAALAMARFAEWIPKLTGLNNKFIDNTIAFVLAVLVMVVLAWLIQKLVLGKLVNQEGITLLMATLGITYFLEGSGQALFGNDIYKIDIGMPKDPVFIFEKTFQGGLLINKEDLVRGADRRGAGRRCSRSSSRRPPPGARCARSPTTTRRRSRSASRSTASGSSSGRWRASSRWSPA